MIDPARSFQLPMPLETRIPFQPHAIGPGSYRRISDEPLRIIGMFAADAARTSTVSPRLAYSALMRSGAIPNGAA